MMSRSGVSAWLVALALVAAACGEDGAAREATGSRTFPPDSFAIVANADIGTGTSRVLFGVLEGGGRRLGSPDDAVTITVSHTDTPGDTQTATGIFTWIIEDAFGLYRAEFDLDRPGLWRAVVQPDDGPALPDTGFNVLADTAAPAIGETAPAPPTPTSPAFPFEEITTDPEPEPRFYELSLDEAVGNGTPTVIVFSTPAFCRTATCGPLLDIVKGIAPQYPDVDFVHVEVYTNLTAPDFAPVPENLAPAVLEEWWNLPSEPWVFVVDPTGTVIARFEGVMAADELAAVL
jgi:hypothetical protein